VKEMESTRKERMQTKERDGDWENENEKAKP
jgi:hypothetical protein